MLLRVLCTGRLINQSLGLSGCGACQLKTRESMKRPVWMLRGPAGGTVGRVRSFTRVWCLPACVDACMGVVVSAAPVPSPATRSNLWTYGGFCVCCRDCHSPCLAHQVLCLRAFSTGTFQSGFGATASNGSAYTTQKGWLWRNARYFRLQYTTPKRIA